MTGNGCSPNGETRRPTQGVGARALAACSRRPVLTLFVLVAVVQVPFALLMPFHIDDPVFIRLVKLIDQNPLNPMGAPVLWDGQVSTDMMSYSHPPLVCYFMYPFFKLGGDNAAATVHLGFIVFSFLLVWGMHRLLAFFSLPALAGATLAFFAPVALTTSHTVMMDLPTLALGVVGVDLFFRALRDNRPRGLLLGGLVVGLACLTSYIAIFFLLPPATAALCRPGRFRSLVLMALLPTAALTAWLGFVYQQTGRFVISDAAKVVAAYQGRVYGDFETRLIYNLIAAGTLMVCPVALFLWKWSTLRGKVYVLLVFLTGFRLALRFPEEGPLHHAAGAIALVAGIIALVEPVLAAIAAARSVEARLRPFYTAIAVWLPAFFLLTLKGWPHGAARYLLWILPPIVVGFFYNLYPSPAPRAPDAVSSHLPFPRRSVFLAVLFAGQISLAFTLAAADLHLARRHREAIQAVFSRYSAPGRTIWYAGEWGLRQAVTDLGGKTLLRYDRRPRSGDILIRPAYLASTYASTYEASAHATSLGRVAVRSDFPFRVLNPSVRAGFWGDYWGLLPLWPAGRDVPLEILEVFRIVSPLPADPRREAENLGVLPPRKLTVIP